MGGDRQQSGSVPRGSGWRRSNVPRSGSRDRRRIDAIARSCQPYLREPLATDRTDEWVGMRPLAPDGLPVIGRLRAPTNAFVATGHSMLGITLGPATGELVADLMATGQVPQGLEAFSPDRFGR